MSDAENEGPVLDASTARSLRWSLTLLGLAAVVVIGGFVVTQTLARHELGRQVRPSADAERVHIPSSGKVVFPSADQYVVMYAQDTPSTGVPRSLDVSIVTDRGTLPGASPPQPVSGGSDGRSYVRVGLFSVPEAGEWTVNVSVPGVDAQALDADRLVIDRYAPTERLVSMAAALLPAIAGMVLGGVFVAGSLFLRASAMRRARALALHRVQGPGGRP